MKKKFIHISTFVLFYCASVAFVYADLAIPPDPIAIAYVKSVVKRSKAKKGYLKERPDKKTVKAAIIDGKYRDPFFEVEKDEYSNIPLYGEPEFSAIFTTTENDLQYLNLDKIVDVILSTAPVVKIQGYISCHNSVILFYEERILRIEQFIKEIRAELSKSNLSDNYKRILEKKMQSLLSQDKLVKKLERIDKNAAGDFYKVFCDVIPLISLSENEKKIIGSGIGFVDVLLPYSSEGIRLVPNEFVYGYAGEKFVILEVKGAYPYQSEIYYRRCQIFTGITNDKYTEVLHSELEDIFDQADLVIFKDNSKKEYILKNLISIHPR